jgi:hypothetical protein
MNIKNYFIYIIIFLLLGEIIHYYIKKSNKTNEGFITKNYNELPDTIDVNKSYPRKVNNNLISINNHLQPIIIKTKIPLLKTGNLPLLGYYGNNSSYASIIPINILRKKILPLNYSRYNSSMDVLNNLMNNNIQLGIIRDHEILLNNNDIKIIVPLYYETVFLLTGINLKDLTHLQLINLSNKKYKLYLSKNDKYILDIIIKYTEINTNNLEIYTYIKLEDAITNFILDKEGLFFCCCHFKNSLLQSLLNSIECFVLEYIPTINSMTEIGNYSFKNPINYETLNNKILNIKMKIENKFNTVYPSIKKHNLNKNKLLSNNNKQIYNTLYLRNSLYINNINLFTNNQLKLLSKNIIKWYQTFSKELNNWNNITFLINDDQYSFNLDEIANVNKKIKFENNMKTEIANLGYIKIKK